MEAKTKRRLSATAFALIATALMTTAIAASATDWRWSYRVLRSPHFELVYRREQKALAKRYILAAEQARELLMPIFKEGPDKTIIFLQDDTDAANGEADFLPYPRITVYPVLPSTLDSIDEYGDWALEMMLHEYTHILNMYPAHGVYVPLKWIFGGVVRPNAVLPKWYLEGLAVDLESALSDHGRLRSSETQAAARALVLDHKFAGETLSGINESGIPSWPYGSRPYLFGGWWWGNVHQNHGADIIGTWNQNFSRRLPFLLDGPMFEQTRKGPAEIFTATKSALSVSAERQIEIIRASQPPQPVGEPVADESGEQTIFALSPSGNRLIYGVSYPNQVNKPTGTQFKLKTRATSGQPFKDIAGVDLFKTIGTLRLRWLDENRVVFDQIDVNMPRVSYRDLYLYDLGSGRVTRLTRGARAQEPAPSPSGKEIVFIQNDGGKNRLARLALNGDSPVDGAIRPLINGNLSQRLSGPEFLNEQEILFVVRRRSGLEQAHVFNLSTRKITPWSERLKAAQNPRRTAAGVLITDASTGVRNAYRAQDGRIEAVSNTLTDIAAADYDPQRRELIVSELGGDGRRLRAFALTALKPPVIPPSPLPAAPKSTLDHVPVHEESYQPVAYLWPRYWIPFIYQVEGGMILQGATGNSDPAGRNSYSLLGSFDTVTRKGSYGATYTNRSLPSEIGLSYAKAETYLGASGATLESQNAGLTLANDWPFNRRDMKWTLGGLWLETNSTTTAYRRVGPRLSWTYSNLNNPLRGWYGVHAELAHEEFLPEDGYLDYGRSSLHFGQSARLGGGHRLSLQTRVALAPRLPLQKVVILGDPNVGGNYMVNLANSDFLLRGYPSGEFVGRKTVNANLEYALPVVPLERGWGSFPLFMQDLEFALFTDAMAVDGAGFLPDVGYVARTLSDFYMGSGAELRLNTTAGYHLPLSFTFGLYYGWDQDFGGGFSPFFGIGLGDLGSLQDKTP